MKVSQTHIFGKRKKTGRGKPYTGEIKDVQAENHPLSKLKEEQSKVRQKHHSNRTRLGNRNQLYQHIDNGT